MRNWMFGPNLCLKPEALGKMPTLRALFRSGSGLDALPCDWAYNTPESIAECVVEHAVALLVSYIRQIPQYNARAKAGLGDYICPPTGVMAFDNAVTAPKEMRFVQNTQHGNWLESRPQVFKLVGDAITPVGK